MMREAEQAQEMLRAGFKLVSPALAPQLNTLTARQLTSLYVIVKRSNIVFSPSVHTYLFLYFFQMLHLLYSLFPFFPLDRRRCATHDLSFSTLSLGGLGKALEGAQMRLRGREKPPRGSQ